MVRYAEGAEVALLDPAELSERLAAVLRSAMPWLLTISEAEASVPEREGKWCAKEVIGHLIDSAVNNLGRIVRLQIEAGERLPGDEQMGLGGVGGLAGGGGGEGGGVWVGVDEAVAWSVAQVCVGGA